MPAPLEIVDEASSPSRSVGYAIGPIIGHNLVELLSSGVVTESLLLAAATDTPFSVLFGPLDHRQGDRLQWSSSRLSARSSLPNDVALMAEVGRGRMTLITYINPAIAILLGALILKEPTTIIIAIGFLVIIVGSILACCEAHRRSGVTVNQ